MALVSGRAVFASALLQAFGHQELDSSWESQWRVFLARGACLAICCGIHMPRLWMCKVLSACLMALCCSESPLAMALGIIEGWYDPAFPPKLCTICDRVQTEIDNVLRRILCRKGIAGDVRAGNWRVAPFGSQVYGLSTSTSDYDLSVAVSPEDEHLCMDMLCFLREGIDATQAFKPSILQVSNRTLKWNDTELVQGTGEHPCRP